MSASTEQSWFTRRAGQIRGPYPGSEISRYLLLGRLQAADEISPDRAGWRPLGEHPELIPEVMREVRTGADRRRLAAARRRADERRGSERRTRRLNPPRIERRGGERRRPVRLSPAQAGAARRPLVTAALMFGLAGLALVLI